MEMVLPKGWGSFNISLLTGYNGLFSDGDWVESKDQDPNGDVRLIQLADIGENEFKDKSNRFLNQEKADELKCTFLKKNDVLIARMPDPIGRSCIFPLSGKYATVVDIAIVRFDQNYFNPFLFSYLVNSPQIRKQVSALASGSTRQRISRKNLDIIHFPFPPLPEQERLVLKLDKLFAQHEKIKTALDRIPQLLKTFREQVLTKAITGRLTEQWRENCRPAVIDESSLIQILEREVDLLNGEHSKAGKSKIKINPILLINNNKDGWPIYTLESVCVVIVDCLHETAKFSNSGFPIIDTNNIEPFRINKNKLRFVDSDTYDKWISRLKPKRGDLTYTREGSIGSAVLIPEDDKYCIGQRTMLFRFSGLLNPSFCEMYINSQVFRSLVHPFIKGVASQHVNIRDLRQLEIPVPSIAEQEEIVHRVESLFAKADAIETRYQTVKAKVDNLPQAILHKAFKGELVPQLPTDGDAKDLLAEIMALKAEPKGKKRK